MRLGIDVDDVLFPWSTRAHEACVAAGITNGNPITQWAFYKDYGCTHDELWDVLHQAYEGGMLRTAPMPSAALALDILRDAGHSVHIVTARGFEGPLAELVRAETVAWLYDWGIPHDSLTFTKKKSLLALDVLADDGPKNIIEVEGAGTVGYLIDSIHNQDFDHPRRVPHIIEFAAEILRAGEAAA